MDTESQADKEHVLKTLCEESPYLQEQYGIVRLALYGSFAQVDAPPIKVPIKKNSIKKRIFFISFILKSSFPINLVNSILRLGPKTHLY